MKNLRFVWDSRKDNSNKTKHRVTFAEAETVFHDDNAIDFPDPDHSQAEERFIILGLSAALRVLVVCYCYRENVSTIRIISARVRQQKRKPAFTESMFNEKRI